MGCQPIAVAACAEIPTMTSNLGGHSPIRTARVSWKALALAGAASLAAVVMLILQVRLYI